MTEAIRKGDRFEITVEVVDTHHGCTAPNCKTVLKDDYYTFDIEVLRGGRRLPRPIGVGDRVRWGNGTLGRVVAVHGNDAWVLWDGSTEPITERIRELTLVEPSHD